MLTESPPSPRGRLSDLQPGDSDSLPVYPKNVNLGLIIYKCAKFRDFNPKRPNVLGAGLRSSTIPKTILYVHHKTNTLFFFFVCVCVCVCVFETLHSPHSRLQTPQTIYILNLYIMGINMGYVVFWRKFPPWGAEFFLRIFQTHILL